jgi:hypothetical protein
MQLALSGWTFFITMFATGLATAWLMFGRRGSSVQPSVTESRKELVR